MLLIKNNFKAISLILLSAVLGGCASSNSVKLVEPEVPDRAIEESLSHLETEILDELRLLAKIRDEKRLASLTEEQKNQRILQANKAKWPDEFLTKVSMSIPPNEAGNICAIIADSAGYDHVFEGVKPRKPIWVKLNLRNEPLSSAVLELGRQTGSAFDLEVYGRSKLVRCVYNREIN